MTNISKKVTKGLSWSFVGQAYTIFSQFTLGIWLARILGPKAYGLVAMVTVFSGFATLLTDFGFSSALIQKKDIDNTDYSTAFWFNLGVSIILFLAFYLLSYSFADFYDNDKLVDLTKVISFQFIISAFAFTQRVQLSKQINFKTLTIIQIVSSLLSFAIALILAYQDFGVWSIVAQNLTGQFVTALLLFYSVRWIPRLVFSRRSFNKLFGFGMSVTAESFLNYISRNFDNLIIGKVLGEGSLGAYSKAYSLMVFPIKNFSNVIKKVLFPSFSLMQSEVSEIKAYYLKVTNLIAFVIFPLMGVVALQSENVVMFFFGADWLDMVPLLKVFSFLGMVQAILTINGTIYLSQGRPGLAFKIGLLSKSIILICIVVGVYSNGVLGVAYGLAVAQILNFYPVFITAARLIHLTLKEQLWNLSKIGLIFIVSMVLTYILNNLITFEHHLYDLVFAVVIYAVIYLVLSHIWKVNAYVLIKSKLKMKL